MFQLPTEISNCMSSHNSPVIRHKEQILAMTPGLARRPRNPELFYPRQNRRRLGDVGLHRQHLGAARSQPPLRLLQRVRLDVGEDDLHALAGEPVGQCIADAACAPGHHCDAALEFPHTASE